MFRLCTRIRRSVFCWRIVILSVWWVIEDSNFSCSYSFQVQLSEETHPSLTGTLTQGGRGRLSPHHSFYSHSSLYYTYYITFRPVRINPYYGPLFLYRLSRPVSCSSRKILIISWATLVGREGVEPPMFLVCLIYSQVSSPTRHTDP